MKREHTTEDQPCGAFGCNGSQHIGTGPNGDHEWCPTAVKRARARAIARGDVMRNPPCVLAISRRCGPSLMKPCARCYRARETILATLANMRTLVSLVLCILALACAHAPRRGYYECAEQCAREHPTSIGFSRGDCIARCQGREPHVNRAPGSGAP